MSPAPSGAPRRTVVPATTPGALRRLLLTAGAAFAAVGSLSAATTPAAYAQPIAPTPTPILTSTPSLGLTPALPPPVRMEDRANSGRLTVSLRDADGRATTYDLSCEPNGGSHPDVSGACGAVDRERRAGQDPFAPVPEGSTCTMLYGGKATAHVTGTWSGRRVDARFDRTNGCEIARWNRLVPLLPDLRG
ncbi:SSI family serine proteinase inhibitor [Streptomyces sp. NPDC088387]|uniref:SSI family serine proteinase inhibitor n=1 Tax=Streptomyces sp. NPDC088387 TaxID=3365859 RepID=UPI00381A07A9